jgi:hypothetical protein
MRKYIYLYLSIPSIALLSIMFISLTYEIYLITWISAITAFFAQGLLLSLNNHEWHLTMDQMKKREKEALNQMKNAGDLIEAIQKRLFRNNIMTKEEVSEILEKKIG